MSEVHAEAAGGVSERSIAENFCFGLMMRGWHDVFSSRQPESVMGDYQKLCVAFAGMEIAADMMARAKRDAEELYLL